MVGCVIGRGDDVLGEGFHRRFGGPHAEIEALRACRKNPRGATAYVTLEPCCIQGKTPPCTAALLEAGIARVVAGTTDPNPAVAGRGLQQLRAAGVAVTTDVCAAQARDLIAPFRTFILERRPWVILKWAQSIDGKIATRSGDSKWISDEDARRHAHRTRARLDAIIVGVETVLKDDPLLTARDVPLRRTALRVVLDSRLRTPTSSQLVRTAREIPTLVVCTRAAPAARRKQLENRGVRVAGVRKSVSGGVDLQAVLERLHAAQCTNVMVEGGGRVLGAFLDAQLADEYHVYIAPRLIGGEAAPGPLHARGPARVADALRLAPTPSMRRLGDGWLLSARPARVSAS